MDLTTDNLPLDACRQTPYSLSTPSRQIVNGVGAEAPLEQLHKEASHTPQGSKRPRLDMMCHLSL
jgi:hypothetical protein